MTYRLLTDPHSPLYEWRVVNGVREVRYNSIRRRMGFIGKWSELHHSPVYGWDSKDLFEPTPERLTLWADLVLNSTL